MREEISRSDAIALIARAREAVCAKAELQELMDDYDVATVFEALSDAFGGVSNGFLSQVCEAISGKKFEVVGQAQRRFPCPCCGKLTLTELYSVAQGTGYDICDYCGWEDDGTRDEVTISSLNRASMLEYRERIRRETNYRSCEKWMHGDATQEEPRSGGDPVDPTQDSPRK